MEKNKIITDINEVVIMSTTILFKVEMRKILHFSTVKVAVQCITVFSQDYLFHSPQHARHRHSQQMFNRIYYDQGYNYHPRSVLATVLFILGTVTVSKCSVAPILARDTTTILGVYLPQSCLSSAPSQSANVPSHLQ